MIERPTLFITNAASARAARKGSAKPETAKCVGPGDQWSIQCRPDVKRGELGRGIVWTLAPSMNSLDAVKKSRLSVEEYREAWLNEPAYKPQGPPRTESVPRCWSQHLEYGQLVGRSSRSGLVAVQPGDTLTCCCGRKAAAEGACHRVWAAYLLLGAGWGVVLDGINIPPEERELLLERK